MQELPGAGQIQSVSVLQSGEQPSPPCWFPSSHVSTGALTAPLPQPLDPHPVGDIEQDKSARPPTSVTTPTSTDESTDASPPPGLGAPVETFAHAAIVTSNAEAARDSFGEGGERRRGRQCGAPAATTVTSLPDPRPRVPAAAGSICRPSAGTSCRPRRRCRSRRSSSRR